jgi:hypothetical protein
MVFLSFFDGDGTVNASRKFVLQLITLSFLSYLSMFSQATIELSIRRFCLVETTSSL